MMLSGEIDGGHTTKFYRNNLSAANTPPSMPTGLIAEISGQNSDGIFTDVTDSMLDIITRGSTDFIDYDNDGDLDIFITGLGPSNKIAKLYRNSRGRFFEDTNNAFSGVYYSDASTGDYDNDGDIDILITGDTGSIKIATLYLNTGGSFTEDTSVSLTGVFNSTGTFGDYDNDGDLDILIAGDTGSTKLTILYRNNTPIANISP